MTDTSRIDRVLRDAVGKVPGMVAMATTATDTIYEGAFGLRDVTRDTKMTLDTVFFYASMSKAVTSAAAMQLVEQGRLSLDQELHSVLPQLADRQVLEGFDAGGKPILRPAASAITIRQLLTHSSGFGYPTWNAEILRYITELGMTEAARDWDDLVRMPLLFDPGTRWNYGISSETLGKVVEAVSGKTLDVYWRDHIIQPLGMRDATVVLSDEQRSRMATPHARQEDGTLTPTNYPRGYAPAFLMGGGALLGTAADYIRFVRMFLPGGVSVLKPTTIETMAQNHIGDIRMPRMRTAMPARSNEVEFFPGMDKTWGLGFMINTQDVPGGRRAGSLAWAGIGNTYYWIDRTSGIGGVILMQILPFADHPALDVLADFERAVYDTFT